MTDKNPRIDATPATPERAWQACDRISKALPTSTDSTVVSEAAWLLYEWWQAAERHDISIMDLARVTSLPMAAMDALRARARS